MATKELPPRRHVRRDRLFGEVAWDDPQGRILPTLQLATILLEKASPFFMEVMFTDLESTPKGLVFA
jgi:hypothetical protein